MELKIINGMNIQEFKRGTLNGYLTELINSLKKLNVFDEDFQRIDKIIDFHENECAIDIESIFWNLPKIQQVILLQKGGLGI